MKGDKNAQFIQFSEEIFRFCEPSTEIQELLNLSNVGSQLEFVKQLAGKLNKTDIDKSQQIKIIAHIFLAVPLKHPLKNACTKILFSQKNTIPNLNDIIIVELFKIISSTTFKDAENINNICNAISSCFDVFSNELISNKVVLYDIIKFLKDALEMNRNYLKINTAHLSPTKKMEIYSYIHNINRLTILALQKYCSLCNSLSDDLIWTEMGELCIFLLCQDDLPLDSKINTCIILIFILKLQAGPDSWIMLLKTCFGIEVITIPVLKNFNCIQDLSAVKLGICTAIVNTLGIEGLFQLKVNDDRSALNFISNNLISLSEMSSVNTAIILGITRGFLIISKLLFETDYELSSNISEDILSFVWSYLDHYVDSVRHVTVQILSNIVKYAMLLDSKGDRRLSKKLIKNILNVQNNQYIYYKSLTALGSEYRCSALLHYCPNLVENMISAISDSSDTANVSTSFEVLMSKHKSEITEEALFSTWVEPVLNRLIVYESRTKNDYSQTLSVMREILLKAVKLSSKIIEMIIAYILQNKTENLHLISEGRFKCILICLNVVRKIGYFDSIEYPINEEIKNWKGVLPIELLDIAVCHANSEICILAFSLIVDSHKTTEPFIQYELNIMVKFIQYNVNRSAPNIRQEILSICRRLLDRWLNSYLKIAKSSIDFRDASAVNPFTAAMLSYENFLMKICSICLKSIFPDANFSRRNLSMQILLWCQELYDKCEASSHGLSIKRGIWKEDHIHALYNYLQDSYECNKQLAVRLLSYPFPYEKLFSCPLSKDTRMMDAIKKASSIKPTDCVTSAYILELVLKSDEGTYESHYSMILKLLDLLQKEKVVAFEDILLAAGNGPMYGLLFCIRHLLGKVNFNTKVFNPTWTSLIDDIISICFEINKAVCPIVNNSSPEGHLPVDFNEGSLYVEGRGVCLRNGKSVTSQMVLLCGWRTVKEVSLLLGDLSFKMSISNDIDDGSKVNGLITKQHILNIGDHFISLLSETKHRGAFEQAYVGFTKLCQRLWKSNSKELHNLPYTWLNDLISAISSGDSQNSKLCSTRRSAGVPFIVQALVITELQVNSSPHTFEKCMAILLKLANPKHDSAVETRTHCLNILRALYRHTALGEYVNPYVADGLMISISGFEGATWAERNSSTLLFSSLMTRVFGVQRTKDSDQLCIRNKMTGRIFFLRYPELYDFFLTCLKTFDVNDKVNIMKPSLYPVLLLLSRLYPSSLEGTDSNLKLVAFIPYLTLCSGSCVLKIRQLVAKAIMPLINPERYFPHVIYLINVAVDSRGKTNFCHGILLQLVKLLENIPNAANLPLTTLPVFISFLKKCLWMLDSVLKDTPCYLISEAYLEIALLLVNGFPSLIELDSSFFSELNDQLSKYILMESNQNISMGREQFLVQAFHLAARLSYISSENRLKSFIMNNFTNPSYEVVSLLLNYLICFYDKKYCNEENLNFEIGIKEKEFINGLENKYITDFIDSLECEDLYKNYILKLCDENTDFQYQHKVFHILAHMPELVHSKISMTSSKLQDDLEKIINQCDQENEEYNYVYLLCLENYLKYNKLPSIYDNGMKTAQTISNLLLLNSTTDSNINNKEAVVKIILNHWTYFNLDLVDDEKFPIVMNHIITTFKLLNDEDVSRKMSALTNVILPNEKIPYNESKSQEILLETFTRWMYKNGIDYAIAMLIILSIGDTSRTVEDDEESPVFDKRHSADIEETCALTLNCMVQMKTLIHHDDFVAYILNKISHSHEDSSVGQINAILKTNNILTNVCKQTPYNCSNLFEKLEVFKSDQVNNDVDDFKIFSVIETIQEIIQLCKK